MVGVQEGEFEREQKRERERERERVRIIMGLPTGVELSRLKRLWTKCIKWRRGEGSYSGASERRKTVSCFILAYTS